MPPIAALDADVISLESSRSRMELLTAFRDEKYPTEIGPGVYDIHSPRLPTTIRDGRTSKYGDRVADAAAALGQSWLRPQNARVAGSP